MAREARTPLKLAEQQPSAAARTSSFLSRLFFLSNVISFLLNKRPQYAAAMRGLWRRSVSARCRGHRKIVSIVTGAVRWPERAFARWRGPGYDRAPRGRHG